MRRHLLFASLLAAALGPAASSAAAAHCQPRSGEHTLARSAQAVVLTRTAAVSGSHPLQTITGCSRRSGHRRVIDVLQRQSDGDPTTLVGLRLAGTRVAYVRVIAPPYSSRTALVADDAVHGGRRHDLSGSWPFDGGGYGLPSVTSWAVNAAGDVAWIAAGALDPVYGTPPPSLILWHAGLGRRQVDAKADLRGVNLAGSVLSWRHNGASRRLDIAAIPRTACKGKWTTGTLDVDLSWATACLRATGQTVSVQLGYGDPIVPIDINGPYILTDWTLHTHYGSFLIDLANTTATAYDESPSEAVIDDHGSMAWVSDGTLWVRDGNGTRTIPGKGTDGLMRDGSTVTWTGGGPTVTLSP